MLSHTTTTRRSLITSIIHIVHIITMTTDDMAGTITGIDVTLIRPVATIFS
jgi:hypothetical protein